MKLWRAKVRAQARHPIGLVTTHWFASVDGERFIEVREKPKLEQAEDLARYINGTGDHERVPMTYPREFFESDMVHEAEVEELG